MLDLIDENIPLDIDIQLSVEIAMDQWIHHHQYSFLFHQVTYLDSHSNLTRQMNHLAKEHDDSCYFQAPKSIRR